jgi:hypothetical protein
MPTYLFYDKEEDKTWEEFMSISEADVFLKANPNIERLINGAPAICDPTRVGVRSKPDEGFRDILRNVKSKHRGSQINTF